MISITDKMRDTLMVVAALCWVFVIYASWVGGPAKDDQLIYFGLLAGAVLTVVYYLMGAVVNEKISIPTLLWPVLINGIFQAIAFTIVYTTKGQKMDFIMGMHPGFFGAMVFYWLGNFVTATFAYLLLFSSKAVPEDEWEEFQREITGQEKLH
jgi:hydrogenase-4 membrane subunit HyfE